MATKKEIICYETDASRLKGRAEKVVFPRKIDEICKIVKISNFDIVPRGAGTGFVGGSVPNNSIVVDMSCMNKILKFDSFKKIVHVEAGMTIKELNERLNPVGFEFPIDISNNGISTIGGMIATNASGGRSMKYGSMRDWVEEIEFVNGKGEIMTVGKSDLMDVCGMEGITGIIVSAKLKVNPLIKRSASFFQTDDINEILSISRRLRLEKEVVMIMYFSKEVSKLLGLTDKYHLMIEFDSERGKITGEEYYSIMKLKNKIYFALASEGYYNSEDPKFFFDKLGEFILFLEERNIPHFGYLGTGVMHPFFKDNEKVKKEDVINFIKKTKAKPGKYGFGVVRKDYLDDFEKKIVRRVKVRHDPFGRLNKNKLIDFEVGAGKYEVEVEASPISPDIGTGKFVGTGKFAKDVGTENIVKEEKREIFEELKTPEEKMNELIKKAEEEEKLRQAEILKQRIERRKEIEVKENRFENKEVVTEEQKKLEKDKLKDKIKDYEYTFDSESGNDKRKVIEDFAKDVSRTIISEKNGIRNQNVDYKRIQDIMTNKNSNIPKNNTINAVSDSPKPIERSSRVSDDEKDLINKIITNKYKKDEEK